jgi:hypothetical protein
MGKPTGDLLERLGPEVEAFERANRNTESITKRTILKGEIKSFDQNVIDLTDGHIDNPVLTDMDNLNFETRYLWIINHNGLFIILENTQNLDASRKVVCHSNITKGEKALQGGELWFLSASNLIINYKSGRYGAETEDQENSVIEYFESLGFDVEVE